MADMKVIGRRIKSGIVDNGITEEQLAKTVGVSRQTVNGWTTGRREISLAHAIRVADAFNWPLDYLAVRN